MAELEVQAPIVAVTVYTDRAQVTRRGVAALVHAGAHDLVIGGLPAGIDLDSLRATGRGTVAVTIVGLESAQRFLTESSHERVRELQAQLQTLQDEDKKLAQRDGVLEQRLETVQKLADKAASRYARALSEGTSTVEAAAQLLDFVSTQTVKAHDERTAIEMQRRDITKQRQAVGDQLQQYHPSQRKRDHCVKVAVEALAGGNFELELSYVVGGASWQPLYDARVNLAEHTAQPVNTLEREGRLALDYGASLRQKTGEDWKDVTLTLSTARPSLGTLPPKLDPHYLDVYHPYAATSGGAMRSRERGITGAVVEESAEMMDAILSTLAPVEADPVQATVAEAEVSSEGATVTFKLPRPMTVPSDGQPHRSTIANLNFASRFDYQAVPRRAQLAYLRAQVTNSSALTLLPGPVNIFRDGEFIGAARLEAIAPGQEFKLFLGPDEQVRAERELSAREVDKNFIGNVRRQFYAYTVKMENLKPYAARATVLDQIPVSRSEQIKVKLRQCEPQPHLDELGILRWELTLPPGAKQQLRYEYSVESPRDVAVTGLKD